METIREMRLPPSGLPFVCTVAYNNKTSPKCQVSPPPVYNMETHSQTPMKPLYIYIFPFLYILDLTDNFVALSKSVFAFKKTTEHTENQLCKANRK